MEEKLTNAEQKILIDIYETGEIGKHSVITFRNLIKKNMFDKNGLSKKGYKIAKRLSLEKLNCAVN